MNNVDHLINGNPDAYCPPYPRLFIYYLEGRLYVPINNLGENFIGNWEEEGYSFLFFSESSDKIVQKLIEKNGQLKLLDQYEMTYDQWQGGKFSSFQIDRFWIIPPWEVNFSKDYNPESSTILLDPGIVFGNGLHTTTHDCIEALSWLYSLQAIDSVLDLGCGTGILAIAACKLGCQNCLAIDFNLLACQTAIQNVRLNAMEDHILVIQGRAENYMDSNAELVVANIHYDIMKQLLEIDGFFQKRWFILSGLMRSQAIDIARQLRRPEIKILKKWERDGVWHTFLGRIN